MSDDVALLHAIYASYEDDASRLVYADWLDEHGDAERAEFIRVQIELSRLTEAGEERQGVRDRERELLVGQHERWAAEVGVLRSKNFKAEFRRGFVEGLCFHDGTPSELDVVTRVPCLRRLTLGRIALTPAAIRVLAALDLDLLVIYDTPFPRDWLELLEALPCGTVLDVSPEGEPFDRDAWHDFQARRMARFATLSPGERYSQARRWQRGRCELRNYTPGMKAVGIADVRACDAEMQLLAELKEVEEVQISESDLTTVGIEHIAKLPTLKALDLSWVRVESVTPLARCTALEKLRVRPEYGIAIGDAGTEGLEQLVNLRELLLRYDYGERTLARLGALRKLTSLDVQLRDVENEESYAALSHLTALARLTIDGEIPGGALRFLAPLGKVQMMTVQVSMGKSDDFAALGRLTALRELHVSGEAITDEAIRHLTPLKRLRVLMAQDTRVTLAGARGLATELAEITIVLDEHVIKSPRQTMTFRRRFAERDDVVSAMVPIHWFDRRWRSTAEPCAPWVEDGWENVSGYNGETVGPAEIRLYAGHEADPVAQLNAITQHDCPDRQSSINESGVVELAGGGASCVYSLGRYRYLVAVVASDGKCAVLECNAPATRFDEFRPLYYFVARSLRVGPATLVSVREEVTIPVSQL